MASVARIAARRMTAAATPANSTLAARAKSTAEHSGSWSFWYKVSIFGAFPAMAAVFYKGFVMAEHPHLDEFVPYEHLRIRRKAFPWGDGQKTLFHTDEANALPDGWVEGHGPSAHH